MDERTLILISIGAATGANCAPCFNHYYDRAVRAGLRENEILEAVEIGQRMKTGAHMVMKTSISEIIDQEKSSGDPCCGPTSQEPCCR